MFSRQADALFTLAERDAVIDLLASNPLIGDEIPGTGGVRKIRVGARGKGKRGGARVVYFWYSADAPIYALLVYAKNEKTNLTSADAKIVANLPPRRRN